MTNRSAPPIPRDSGLTLLEVLITLASIAPLVIAFTSMMSSYTISATIAHNEVTALGESQRILQAITSELSTGSSNIGHSLSLGISLPHGESGSDLSLQNPYYCQGMTGIAPAMNQLHNTKMRDLIEHWYPEWSSRRFYVYATYKPFDTIEYQKVRTPVGSMASASILGDNLQTSWSRQRKITLEPDGTVLLIVRELPGNPEKRVVLGRGVQDLDFHINADRHILVRLSVRASPVDPTSGSATLRTSMVTIKPRSGLN